MSSSKGTHAYPYLHQIWAYDANDLVAVKNGQKDPSRQPYATYQLDEIDSTGSATISGAAYDPASGRLFVTERYADNPRVHVFQIAKP